MAKSTIDVINKSLILLGANIITDLSEGSEESTYAASLWDGVRQACLRIHPWNFALIEIELPAVSGGSDFKHQYQYNLPADFIRLITVYDDGGFKIKGKSIYSNRDSCKIRYIYDNTDVASWDVSFSNVVAYKLASELAYPITKSASLMDAMTQQFARHLIEAKAIDGSEDIEDPIAPHDNAFIGVRF